MALRLDLTSDVLHRLEQIAAANHRDLKEQVLYYLEWAITLEWDINGADIEAKLAHRHAQHEAYWRRPRGLARDAAPLRNTDGGDDPTAPHS